MNTFSTSRTLRASPAEVFAAFSEQGISLKWIIGQYAGIAKDDSVDEKGRPNTDARTRMAALEKLERVYASVALAAPGVAPDVHRMLQPQEAARVALPDAAGPDPIAAQFKVKHGTQAA